MRRFPFLVLMIVAIAAAITVLIPSTQEANNGRHAAHKIAAPLRRAANYDRSDLERIRVIVKATDGIQPGQIYAKLQSAGASIGHQMDALGLTVAELPLAKLEEIASHDEIAWISPDQPQGHDPRRSSRFHHGWQRHNV